MSHSTEPAATKEAFGTEKVTPDTVAELTKTSSPQTNERQGDAQDLQEPTKSYKHDYRFWTILFALCITSLLGSLEHTVVVTSLPTIVEHLNFGSSYVWVGNVFFLTRWVGRA